MTLTKLGAWWHPIAEASELVDAPKRFALLGDYVVAYRDDAGAVAFRDICVHRGAALSLGQLRDGCLRCPYHGWEYDRDGRCVRIPSRPVGSPIPQSARLTRYQVAEAFDLVWVAMEEPVAPLPSFPGDEYGKEGWRGFLSYRSHWHSSAARAVENFMDFSHFPFVHTDLLGSEDRTVIDSYEVRETDYGLWYAFEQDEPSDLYGRGGTQRIRYEYYLYLPFTIHLKKIEADGESATLISMVASPTSPITTELFLWIVRNHSFDRGDLEFKSFTDRIMEQDRIVVESQRPEELPLELVEELHIKVPDAASIAYRRMLADAVLVKPFEPYGS